MAKSTLSAVDAEILKSAFRNEIRDNKTPETEWRALATKLIQLYSGSQSVDPDLLEWIMREVTASRRC